MDASSNLPPAGTDDPLAALRAGDAAATETFVRDNAGWMLALARRYVTDQALAEDVVQAAFTDIFRGLDNFEGRSTLKTWMHRIVVNQALMSLRKSNRMETVPIDDLLPDFNESGCRIEERWTTTETPESLLQKAETRENVISLIDQLPESYRAVLLLRDIEELSTEEVAAMLSISEANVKVRLHRARAALKKLLEPLFKGETP